MADWQPAEYGPSWRLDLGAWSVVADAVMKSRDDPVEYCYHIGKYYHAGFATIDEAKAAAEDRVRYYLKLALDMLSEQATQPDDDPGEYWANPGEPPTIGMLWGPGQR